jgi:hypothetical protein
MLPLHHRLQAFTGTVGMEGMALKEPLMALLQPLQNDGGAPL